MLLKEELEGLFAELGQMAMQDWRLIDIAV